MRVAGGGGGHERDRAEPPKSHLARRAKRSEPPFGVGWRLRDTCCWWQSVQLRCMAAHIVPGEGTRLNY